MKALEVIGASHAERVAEMLGALFAEGKEGEYISFAFVAERLNGTTSCGVVGRYRHEPIRCLGELTVMKTRLAHLAAKQKEEVERVDFSPTGT